MDVTLELKSYGTLVVKVETTFILADRMKLALRRVFSNPEHLEITDSRSATEEGRKAAESWLKRERELRAPGKGGG